MPMTDDQRELELLKLITAAEHHFNNLGFNIRALASTWLLATLAGVGWILKDLPANTADSGLVVDKVELLILLCIVSSVGIFVLWIMDIMVYQRLLNVWFDARRHIETGTDFPPIRLEMKKLFDSGRATELIMVYYLALAGAPLGLAWYIARAGDSAVDQWAVIAIFAVMLGAIYRYSPKDRKWMKSRAGGESGLYTENFFNLDASNQGKPRQLAKGMTTRIFAGDDAMISLVRIKANKSGEIHSHPQEQWGLCLRGAGVRIQDGARIPVGEGDFWRTPGNVDHGFSAGPDGALIYDVFAPPRREYEESGNGFS